MALNANTYYSNSIQGIPGAGVDVNVETADAAPRYPAGYLVERADGNRFRYCHVGTATNSGLLVGPTTASAGATYAAGTVVASATAVQAEYPILPGQVGSHYVQFTIASIAANKYQGGYLITTGGTGLGQTYRIVGNTATGTPNSTDLYIQLAEALQVAVTAATGTIIVGSMFTDLAAAATSATQVTGVLMATTTSTNLWAWVCTKGTVGCTEDATSSTPVAGVPIVCSLNLAGAYQAVSTATATVALAGILSQPVLGYVRTVAGGTKNRQGVIFLTLE
jgi:hypothetical protein